MCTNDPMPDTRPHPDATNRAQIEAQCLARALIPMPEDDERRLAAKAVALALVGVWLAITISLTLEGVDAVRPPFYTPFTALVFLLVGKLWDLEAQSLMPGGES